MTAELVSQNPLSTLQLPTFTVPTYRCASLILPFDDIREILQDQPHIVQVGLGELHKNQYQLDLGIDWLHAPAGWPVMLSAFNPGNPTHPQVFMYNVAEKKIQVSAGSARVMLGYEEMMQLASKANVPKVDIVCLPVEQVDGTVARSGEQCKDEVADAVAKSANHVEALAASGEPAKPTKKRKVDRKQNCIAECIQVLKSHSENGQFKIVLSSELVGAQGLVNSETVVGSSSRSDNFSDQSLSHLKFVRIVNIGSPQAILSSISDSLKNGADVLETDFPFRTASLGLLFNHKFNLVDMKSSDNFHNHNSVLEYDAATTPESVVEAGAHSFSYMHHLFRCEELSGPILLATINLYQFKLFVSGRGFST